jgi:hypothetical protein
MSALHIFVSHSHQDQAFCQKLVQHLREAGADVWYDEHNLRSGPLRRTIDQELRRRQIFLLILSPAALGSLWVQEETEWFYDLYRQELRKPGAAYTLLPILLESVQEDDIPLFYRGFTRVAQPNGIPYPHDEAIRRTLKVLDLTPLAALPLPPDPPPAPLPASESQPEQVEKEQVGLKGENEVELPALLESESGEGGSSSPNLPVKVDTAILAPAISGKIKRRFLISLAVNILLGIIASFGFGFSDPSNIGFLGYIALFALIGAVFAGIDFLVKVFQVTLKNIISNWIIFLGSLILVFSSIVYLSNNTYLPTTLSGSLYNLMSLVVVENSLILIMSIIIAVIKWRR